MTHERHLLGSPSREPPPHRRSGHWKIRTEHQIDVAAEGLAPFPEFFRQSALGCTLAGGFQGHQALMHQIEGVINQLSSLFRGHGAAGDGTEAQPNQSVGWF